MATDDDIRAALRECEGLVSSVAPELKAAAFQVLLTRKLFNAREVPSSQPGVEKKGAVGASIFRSAGGVREKVIAAIAVADPENEGITLGAIRDSLTRYRQKLPGNLPRDIGALVKVGLVLPLEGTGREARYALSQDGLEVAERLSRQNL